MSFAVVKIAGKQYLVSEGDRISVNASFGESGREVTFSDVLLLENEGNLSLGTPLVEKAIVTAKIVFSGLGDKLDVYKFKAKSRYRRHTGFRPVKTIIEIETIKIGQTKTLPVNKSEPVKKARKTAKE